MTRFPMVSLSDVLELELDDVQVNRAAEYQSAGVRSFGRGLFARPPVSGATSSYSRLFRLHAGQVVLSRLFAWEGAVALVPPEFDGWYVSPEFPTFKVNTDRAVPSLIGHFLSWKRFHEELAGSTRGLGQRRQRVHVEEFLELAIPLPPIDEQLGIADRLGRLADVASAAARLQSTATRMDQAFVESSISSVFEGDGWAMRALGEVAEVNPSPRRLDPAAEVAFVPMAAVDGVTGRVRGAEFRHASEVGPGYKQFREGDVIFARITPCMQNGKAAIYSGTPTYGYGSTEFHVIRAGPEVSPKWVHRIVRTRRFRLSAAQHFTGTAGQQRVPASFLKTVRIPVPPLDVQIKAIEEVDRLSTIGLEIRKARGQSEAVLAALVPAALNEAFAGLS
jgi:type I restriction enzyme S subunit